MRDDDVLNKAILLDTFALDNVPVSQRWAVAVTLKTMPRLYFVLRGIASGKLSFHGQPGGPLQSKTLAQVIPLAKEAIEQAVLARAVDALEAHLEEA